MEQQAVAQRLAEGPQEGEVCSLQLWLTMMWPVGTGLPWDWRIGPSDSSERAQMLEMLLLLPANALITAHAGFIGSKDLRAILGSQR